MRQRHVWNMCVFSSHLRVVMACCRMITLSKKRIGAFLQHYVYVFKRSWAHFWKCKVWRALQRNLETGGPTSTATVPAFQVASAQAFTAIQSLQDVPQASTSPLSPSVPRVNTDKKCVSHTCTLSVPTPLPISNVACRRLAHPEAHPQPCKALPGSFASNIWVTFSFSGQTIETVIPSNQGCKMYMRGYLDRVKYLGLYPVFKLHPLP